MDLNDKIMTPTRLWQDFDAEGDPLNYGVAAVRKTDGLVSADLFFDALTAEDGNVRAFVRAVYPSDAFGLPAILYIDDYDCVPKAEILENIASKGYAVFSFDYCGKEKDGYGFTKYPASLSYGRLSDAGDRLDKATDGGASTSVFLWSRIARRVVTLINALPQTNGKTAVVGVKNGGNIAWQLAATDDRITCFAPVINAGWQEYRGIFKYGDAKLEIDGERERWLACAAVQAYAKFVKCPVLYLGCSNNRITAIERLNDTLNLLPEETPVALSLTTGTLDSLEYESLNTLIKWLEACLKGGDFKLKSPALTLKEENEQLLALVRCDAAEDIADCVLSYCRSEPYPSLRYWHRVPIGLNLEGKAGEEIPVYENTAGLFAYVTVYYKNGLMLSSRLDTIVPETAKPITFKKSRIIYERKMGLSAFVADGGAGLFITRDSVSLIGGPLDILGVAAANGDLSNYAIGDEKYRGEEGYILQFDVYCPNSAQCEAVLFTVEETGIVPYSASFSVNGGSWQKVAFAASDFKTKSLQPLKDWGEVKKLSFKNAAGLLFNNILWV